MRFTIYLPENCYNLSRNSAKSCENYNILEAGKSSRQFFIFSSNLNGKKKARSNSADFGRRARHFKFSRVTLKTPLRACAERKRALVVSGGKEKLESTKALCFVHYQRFCNQARRSKRKFHPTYRSVNNKIPCWYCVSRTCSLYELIVTLKIM